MSNVDSKDDRTARDRLLGRASEARKQNEADRKWAVLGLMVDRLGLDAVIAHQLRGPAATRDLDTLPGQLAAIEALSVYDAAVVAIEGEILSAAYGDSGRGYWQAWLDEGVGADLLARLLAAHTAGHAVHFESLKKQILTALAKLSEAEPRAVIDRLLQNLNTRHFVPESLREFLNPTAIVGSGVQAAERKGTLGTAALKEFLLQVADGVRTESALRPLAAEHFCNNRITDAVWRAAFSEIPEAKKRPRGRPIARA
jgi:hypothetical protein